MVERLVPRSGADFAMCGFCGCCRRHIDLQRIAASLCPLVRDGH